MKASAARFRWFLLTAVVIGPLAFLGCFLDSKGLSCIPGVGDLELNLCWNNLPGRMAMLTDCGLMSGYGTGLLHEFHPEDVWTFSGDRLTPGEEEAANADMAFRFTVSGDSLSGEAMEIEVEFHRYMFDNRMDRGLLRSSNSTTELIQVPCRTGD